MRTRTARYHHAHELRGSATVRTRDASAAPRHRARSELHCRSAPRPRSPHQGRLPRKTPRRSAATTGRPGPGLEARTRPTPGTGTAPRPGACRPAADPSTGNPDGMGPRGRRTRAPHPARVTSVATRWPTASDAPSPIVSCAISARDRLAPDQRRSERPVTNPVRPSAAAPGTREAGGTR